MRLYAWKLLLLCCMFVGSLAGLARAEETIQDLYARVLERYSAEVPGLAGTGVDYSGLRDSMDWKTLTRRLEKFRPERLTTRNQRMAFWINAYNILAIDMVQRHDSIQSVREIGSVFSPVWNKEAGRIGGRSYSLREIEDDILRPMHDPRIHAALVCASTSCPALRRTPYSASQLQTDLDRAMRLFLANPGKGLQFDAKHRSLRLSKVFDWFADDYAVKGGVVPFLLPYMPADIRRLVEKSGSKLRISYLRYDWRLNRLVRTTNDSMPSRVPKPASEETSGE